MRDLSLDKFSEELFSKAPIPGGGGATALVGSLAVSLGAMAANLTVGKAKYAEYTTRLEEILIRAEELRLHLLELINEDAEGFGEVSKAYKLKPANIDMIEKALVSAATPPLKMMEAIKEVIELLYELSDKTSVLVVSDVGVGAKLAGAALSSAYLNVVVNTRLMKNKAEAESLEKKAENLYSYEKKADEIYDKIVNKLSEK